MSKIWPFLIIVTATAAWADGFFTPTSFPKTVNDLSFVDRMELMDDGYAAIESVYDENGHCISGCAYTGITLEEATAAIERRTAMAAAVAQKYDNPDDDTPTTNIDQPTQMPYGENTPPSTPGPSNNTNIGTLPSPTPGAPTMTIGTNHGKTTTVTFPNKTNTASTFTCARHSNILKPGAIIPSQPPLEGKIVIASDFGPRKRFRTNNGHWSTAAHAGLDISAGTGTPIYATADGIVYLVTSSPSAGKYVVLKHAENYYTAYFHMSDNSIVKKGDYVQSGCLIGLVGSTGNVTGPHLHYNVYYQPGDKFNMKETIDPVYPHDYLGAHCHYKHEKSSYHRGKTLPCETK